MGLFRRRASDDVIDLRDEKRELLERGMPTRCPQCSAMGYLDRIDLTNGVMRQHCPSCRHRWTVSPSEIATT